MPSPANREPVLSPSVSKPPSQAQGSRRCPTTGHASKDAFNFLATGGSIHNKKEYVQWVAGAKREETRQKRMATTVAWQAEGKSRNWKYEGK